jgi:hypothetical protein
VVVRQFELTCFGSNTKFRAPSADRGQLECSPKIYFGPITTSLWDGRGVQKFGPSVTPGEQTKVGGLSLFGGGMGPPEQENNGPKPRTARMSQGRVTYSNQPDYQNYRGSCQ